MKITRRTDPVAGSQNQQLDFYATPTFATESLLKVESFKGLILEPCCGRGAISKVLIKNNYKVSSYDINANEHKYGQQRDFLEQRNLIDNIVTNPPYNLIEPIILHGLKIIKNKMCLLIRLHILETQHRYDKIFKDNPPARIHLFTSRINFLGGKTFGGMLCTSWFVWDNDYCGPTTIDWINCKEKK